MKSKIINDKIIPYLLIAPVSIILILIMGVGIINCISQSLGFFPQIGLEQITLSYYREIFRDSNFLESLIFSLKISLVSSILAVTIGILLAYIMSQNRFSKVRYMILNIPLVVPHIIVVLLVFIIFSQTGIISRVFYFFNIIKDSSEFIPMVSDKNGIGIILVYLWKGIPYITLMVYNILKNINDNLQHVSINLGASKLQTFRYIVLPLAMPTIISSFIIIFAFSFGSFEVPFLIGASTPKALPVQAYLSYASSDLMQRPISMCINVLLSGISFILLIIYDRFFNKISKYNV